MSVLHMISSSRADVLQCIPVADDDAVLLIEDGTLQAVGDNPVMQAWVHAQQVWILTADMQARGLESSVPETVQRTDYDGLVRLTETHDTILTW